MGTHIPLASGGPVSGPVAMKAIDDMLQLLWNASATTLGSVGGTANAVTAASSPAIDAVTAGRSFWIQPAQSAGAGAINLTIDSFPQYQVLDESGSAFPPQRWIASARLLLYFDGIGFRVVSRYAPAYPKGYFFGCLLSNDVTSPLTVIDISAGAVRSDDDTVDIAPAAMTKRIDTTWVAGTGNGGLDTGVVAASTAYDVYAIAKADGTGDDFLITTSGTAPTMPTNYTVKRIVGSLWVNGSTQISAGVWYTDGSFIYSVPVQDLNANTTGSTSRTRSLSVPPNSKARFMFQTNYGTNPNTQFLLSELTQADTSASTAWNFASSVTGAMTGIFELRVSAARFIRIKAQNGSAGDQQQIWTLGWWTDRAING